MRSNGEWERDERRREQINYEAFRTERAKYRSVVEGRQGRPEAISKLGNDQRNGKEGSLGKKGEMEDGEGNERAKEEGACSYPVMETRSATRNAATVSPPLKLGRGSQMRGGGGMEEERNK